MFADAQRICADAYEKVDTRDLIEPPGTKLLGIAIVLVGLIIVLFFAYAFLYRDSAQGLNRRPPETSSKKPTPLPTAVKESGQ